MSFNVENYFSEKPDGNIILFYKGNVDSDVINHVLDTVEDKMVAVNEQSRLRKKYIMYSLKAFRICTIMLTKFLLILKTRVLKDMVCSR
ncbi:MAG: hypothetical protein IPJ37_21870 [Bacteroidales bacterium]|nr:hypothetical protein [Bacteroidales bacterium]